MLLWGCLVRVRLEVFALMGVGRVLALACGVLLALPPGWCCKATARECCGPAPLSPSAPAKCCVDRTCAGKTCAAGCCSKEPADQGTTPAPTPQKPNRPCDTSCCEYSPAVAPKVDHPVIDLGPVGVQISFTETADPGEVAVSVSVPPRSAFPPLNVLHCVWLC